MPKPTTTESATGDAREVASKPASPAHRAMRLRTLLTVPFVLLILIPALIIAGTSLYTGLQAVDVLSRQLMDDISARVGQMAVHQLEEAAVTMRATFPNADDNFNASLDVFVDDEKLERKLFELTAGTRTTGYVYFGRENGSFVGVDRGRPGARAAATVRLQAPGGKPRHNFTARNPGDRTHLLEIEDRIYEARERPWYKLAKSAQHLIWAPVYVSFASRALVTTVAQPVITSSGSLFGVLAADVELSELSAFMKSVSVSANGVAFIVDREGMLVASSTPDQPFRNEDGVQKRVSARESSNGLVRAAAQWWRTPGRETAVAPLIGMITSTGEKVDVASRRVTGIDGIDWDIVVAIPRSDFTAPIVKSAISMFAVIIAALLAALLLGLWLLRRVTRDVDQLVGVTREISADGLPAHVPTTTLAETGVLAKAFGEMVDRLRQSLDTIRTQNEKFVALNITLEDRVERRTLELDQQNLTLTEEIIRRQRLERDLRVTSQSAQKAAEDKARFLAILSHELRTPLQAVVGASHLLAAGELGRTRTDAVDTLDAASKSLLTLIDGVLSYSKLEAGVVTPTLHTFALRNCVDDAVRVARAAQSKPTISLSVQIDHDVPPMLHTDEGMLRQVLINLLVNALKFTVEGEICVDIRVANAPRDGDSMQLDFKVTDTGPGVDLPTQYRLFQPFQQGRSPDGQEGVGSGLGLVICSLLVRALGGDIEMHSEPGKGTCISFSILAQTAHDDLAAPLLSADGVTSSSTAQSPALSRALRVLVVEDNHVNRDLIAIMLAQLGHSVVGVADGEAAIDAVATSASNSFDIVLMDLNLPRIGGIEATRRILQGYAVHGEPPLIIALTASVSDADRLLCAAAGMTGFLTKPATVFSLDNALHNAMKNHASSVTADAACLLDHGTLNSLAELEKRAADPFLVRLIDRFLKGLPEDVARVKAEWLAHDLEKTEAAAHALAGAAAAVGAGALSNAARRMCDAPDDVCMAELASVSERTSEALLTWRNDLVARTRVSPS